MGKGALRRGRYTRGMEPTERILLSIYYLIPEIETLIETRADAHATPPDLAARRGGPSSPVESTVYRGEELRAPLLALEAYARDWGWDGSGAAVRYLLTELPRRPEPVDPAPFARILSTCERALDRSSRRCPLPHDHASPALEPTPGGYYCATCGVERTEEDLVALRGWVLRNTDPLVTREEASALLGVRRGTLRVWVHRGRLEETEGRFRLSAVIKLLSPSADA